MAVDISLHCGFHFVSGERFGKGESKDNCGWKRIQNGKSKRAILIEVEMNT
jgi:hypothetical protein